MKVTAEGESKVVEEKKFEVSRGWSVAILVVLALLWLMHMADRFIMVIALNPIKEAFNLTDAQAGLLTSLLTAGIAVIGIPMAVLADRWARRKVVSVMALTWSVFTLATGLATQFWHLVVSRVMVGSGEAGYAPAGTAWLSVVFPKEMRSRIMAIFYACSQLGMVVGLVFGGMLISATNDWRTPFYVFAIPGVILAIIAFFLPDYKSVRHAGESMLSKAFFKDWGDVFKIKSYWLVTVAAACVYFMIVSMSVWTPTLLIRAYNMNTGSAGMAYGMVQLVILLVPIGGILIDRWNKRNSSARPWSMAILCSILAAFGLIVMLSVGAPLTLWLALGAVMTVAFGVFIPVILAVTQDIVPVRLRSTSVGVFNFLAQLTGATLGPIVVGAISDASGGGAHGIQVGLLWTVPAAFLAIVFSLLLLKYYPADSAKVSDVVLAEK
jgi:MFS family permease